MNTQPDSKLSWWILIATGILGLLAAAGLVVARYYEIQKMKAEADRAQVEANRAQSENALKIDGKQLPDSSNPLEKNPKVGASSALLPGLIVREYPRHDQQKDESGFIRIEELGEPTGKPFVVWNLNGWKYNESRNAMASGFLKIEQAGEYAFVSNNFYDRNALYVNDRILCEFRDLQETGVRITLKPGLIPIQSVGYVGARGSVRVTWIPPGETKLTDIPPELLFHQAAASSK